MTACLNTGIGIGLVVTYRVQYGTSNLSGGAAWRLPLGLQLVPAVIVVLQVFFRPESPRWVSISPPHPPFPPYFSRT